MDHRGLVTAARWRTHRPVSLENYRLRITGSDQPLMGLLALGIVAVGNYVIMNLFVAILLLKMGCGGPEETAP